MQDHVSFDLMLKATPIQEGAERMIYFEASNEGIDQQGERVLAKALSESAAMFKAHGNIDIDHLSLLRKGTPEGIEAEIGYPIDAVINDKRTFVKAQLYQGDSRLAKNANMVWESLTAISPPARWYPSVGGSVLGKSQQIDPLTKASVTVINSVRWTNVALSRTPVNHHIGTVSTAPVGTFCKSLNSFVLSKGLEAGYGTDSAALVGGGALRIQSMDTGIHSYFDFRERLSRDILDKKVGRDINNYAVSQYGLPKDQAAQWVEKFLSGVQAARSSKYSQRSK